MLSKVISLTIQEAASFLNLSIPCLYNKGKQGMSYEKERDFYFSRVIVKHIKSLVRYPLSKKFKSSPITIYQISKDMKNSIDINELSTTH
jgi:hypothetical protein